MGSSGDGPPHKALSGRVFAPIVEVEQLLEDTRIQFDASYEPIVVGQALFISSAQTDSVSAFDTHTGKQKWQFFAEGPV
jgi:hypothetical protein